MESQGASVEVEGHGLRWSDENLKQVVTQVESALEALQNLSGGENDDVEGHGVKWSDESLKQAITKLDDALQSLRGLEGDGGDDVEGHAWSWSDENLKQAVTQVQSALETLRSMGSDEDAEVGATISGGRTRTSSRRSPASRARLRGSGNSATTRPRSRATGSNG